MIELNKLVEAVEGIMSSGNGIEMMDWHRNQIRGLIEKHGKDLVKQAVIKMYVNMDIEDVMEDELDFMKEELGLTVNVSFE